MFPVFTCMPDRITVGSSGLCCFVPCLFSTVTFHCLLMLSRHDALGLIVCQIPFTIVKCRYSRTADEGARIASC